MSHGPFRFLFNAPPDPAERRQDNPTDYQTEKSCRVILSGQLIYADAQPHAVNCLILELFPDGARIETDQTATIPEYSFFRIGTALIHPVRCIPIRGNSVEVRYIDRIESMP